MKIFLNNISKKIKKINSKIYHFIKAYKIYIISILIVLLSILSVIIQSRQQEGIEINNIKNDNNTNNKISVYITGEVINPGVYELNKNCRIADLLNICGGVSENADLDKLNLAKKLVDSDKITVTKKEKKLQEDEIISENDNSTVDNKININSASKNELMELNGIGESTANKIIEYRKNQKFLEIEDIMNVSGIGNSKFHSIKDNIIVN